MAEQSERCVVIDGANLGKYGMYKAEIWQGIDGAGTQGGRRSSIFCQVGELSNSFIAEF